MAVPFVMPRTAQQADFIGYQIIASEEPCLGLAQTWTIPFPTGG